MSNDIENTNKAPRRKHSPAVDLEALAKAYSDSLDKVTFGDKPVTTGEKKPAQSSVSSVRKSTDRVLEKSRKSSYVPTDYKPKKESSAEHDRIVRKIKQNRRTLSHSVWTDQPVLKPPKSVWLDEATAQLEKTNAAAKAKADELSRTLQLSREQIAGQSAAPQQSAQKPVIAADTVVPILSEKPKKQELVMNFSQDGRASVREVKRPATKRQVTVEIPDSVYKEYEVNSVNHDTSVRRNVTIQMPLSKQIKDEPEEVKAPETAAADKAEQVSVKEDISEVKTEAAAVTTAETADTDTVTKAAEPAQEISEEIPQEETPAAAEAAVEEAADSDDISDDVKEQEQTSQPDEEPAGESESAEEQAEELPENEGEAEPENTDEGEAEPEKKEAQEKTESPKKPVSSEGSSYDDALIEMTRPMRRLKRKPKPKYHELEFNFINCVVCLAVVFITFVSLIVMDRESGFISSENRNLAVFPRFTASSYFSGEYTKDITTFFTDTIPGRESFKKFCAAFGSNLGINLDDTVVTGNHKAVKKQELDKEKVATTTTVTADLNVTRPTNMTTTEATSRTSSDEEVVEIPEILDDGAWEGDVIVFGKGENVRAVAAYYGQFEVGAYYAETINKWKEELPDVNVYNMSIPTSAAYYMPKNFADTVSDQKDNIDNIASELKGIINVDVYDNIAKHVNEYIYSRTDHHWQPRGAYYAGQVFAEKAGVPYPDLDTYDEWQIEDFLGTMYGYSDYNQELADNPDTFIYYKPDNEYTVTYYDTDFTNGYEDSLFFDFAEGVNCYSAILNVDSEIAEIDTDCDNGRVLVVFKDSYGNALAPFLTHSFSKIYICDFRYFDVNAIEFCRKVGCTDLLFAISLTSCSTEMHINAINNDRIQDIPVVAPWENVEEPVEEQVEEPDEQPFDDSSNNS